MNSSDTNFSEKITQKILSHLTNIGYRSEKLTYSLNKTFSMKSVLSDSQSDIHITETNTFLAKLDKRLYSECLQRDFAYGSLRVRSLCAWLRNQESSDLPSAWLLVSSYYAAFFIANEILRAGGRFIVYLDQSQLCAISDKAPSCPFSLNKGTWCGKASEGDPGEVKIRFNIRNGGHHEQVWIELTDMLSKAKDGMSTAGKASMDRFLQFLGENSARWPSPSVVRNEWNYSMPEFFGSVGESLAKEFRKRNGKVDLTLNWAKEKRIHLSEANEASGINYCVIMLNIIYDKLNARVLNVETLKELQKRHALAS